MSYFTKMWETPKTPPESGGQDQPTRSRVSIHFAITADGKASTVAKTPAQFTSAQDKRRLLLVRSENDAVMVARGTLEKDRMSMSLPDEALRNDRIRRGLPTEPLRVIISGSGRISLDLPIFRNTGAPIILYTTTRMDAVKRVELGPHLTIHDAGGEHVDLRYVLNHLLSQYRVGTVVCEGGPALVKSLARFDLVDRVILTVAAKLFGGRSAPTITGLPADFLPASRRFQLVNTEIGDNEFYLTYEHEVCTKRTRL